VSDVVCGRCGRDDAFGIPVALVMVFAPLLKRPHVLVPEEDYRICMACEMVFTFVNRAVASNEAALAGGPWSRAIIVLQNGKGFEVTPHRMGALPVALA
jgi:hypothetical protein